MNRRLICLAAITIVLTSSALAQMSDREFDRIDKGKITKNEAQHLVLKEYPGAKVKKCELRQEKNHSVWLVDVITAGSRGLTRVQVDGVTGKILKPSEKTDTKSSTR